jgi:hypothetical protein
MPTTQITPLNYGVALNAVTATTIVPANPQRGALLIHNPNATLTIWVAPLGTTPVKNGAGSYAIFAGADRVFAEFTRATCGWSGIMDSATGNVSALEFTT